MAEIHNLSPKKQALASGCRLVKSDRTQYRKGNAKVCFVRQDVPLFVCLSRSLKKRGGWEQLD